MTDRERQTGTGAWISWDDHDAAEVRLGRELATWPMSDTAVGAVLFRSSGAVDLKESIIGYLLAINKPPELWPPNRDLLGAFALRGWIVDDDYLKKLRGEAKRRWKKQLRSRRLAQEAAANRRRVEELTRR